MKVDYPFKYLFYRKLHKVLVSERFLQKITQSSSFWKICQVQYPTINKCIMKHILHYSGFIFYIDIHIQLDDRLAHDSVFYNIFFL